MVDRTSGSANTSTIRAVVLFAVCFVALPDHTLAQQTVNCSGSGSSIACGTNSSTSNFGTAVGVRANASNDLEISLNQRDRGFPARGGMFGHTAVGFYANGSGGLGHNTAVGFASDASGGAGGFRQGRGSNNVAVGYFSDSSGEGGENIAIGTFSDAEGDSGGNLAIGDRARASGERSTNIAIGNRASAVGDGLSGIAIGAGAIVSHADAAAFGTGAQTTRAGQQVFGTTTNTYTLSGLPSSASSDAQGAVVGIITTDASGNVASDGGALQNLATTNQRGITTNTGLIETNTNGIAELGSRFNSIDEQVTRLDGRDEELAQGIAVSMALQQPQIRDNQSFAMRLAYGNFDGTSAVAVTAAGVVSRGAFGQNTSVTVDLGMGTSGRNVGGTAGVTFGW